MSFKADTEEMAPVIHAILEVIPETPQFPAAEAWLAYLLCMSESSLYREEIIRKSESLNIQEPPVTEIDWAFKRLEARLWLQTSYAIESAKTNSWDGDWSYSISQRGKRQLHQIIDATPNYREASKKLEEWLSTHPPDWPYQEVTLAYTMYYNELTTPLSEIIKEMDRLDYSYSNAHVMGAAFLRLRRRGWLAIGSNNSYGLTSEARQLMDTIIKSEASWGRIDDDLEKWMYANPPPGYEPFNGDPFE